MNEGQWLTCLLRLLNLLLFMIILSGAIGLGVYIARNLWR